MDADQARALLTAERATVERLLAQTGASAEQAREAGHEVGDAGDLAQPLAAEGVDDAIAAGLQERLAAVDRAEERLAAGTFGRSVRSGLPIPDERLEANPTAELTVEEAAADPNP